MKCPRCQQESPPDADFCPEYGAKLVSGPAAGPSTSRPRTRLWT